MESTPYLMKPQKKGYDWEKDGYRTFEEFAKEWQDFYDDLETFYKVEFDETYFKLTTEETSIDPSETDEDIEKLFE